MKTSCLVIGALLLTGCYGPMDIGEGTGAGQTSIASSALKQAWQGRWNQVVDANPTPGFDFHWTDFEYFPHPTFQGGSAAAYQSFATTLLAFFRQGDNFDFLAQNHLFDVRLYSRTSSPTDEDQNTSMRELVDMLVEPGWSASIDEATQSGLAEFQTRIAQAT